MHLPDDWYDWYDTCGALMTLFYCDSFRRLFYVVADSHLEGARIQKFLAIARKRQRGLVVVLQDPDRRGKFWGGVGWGDLPICYTSSEAGCRCHSSCL